MRTGAVAVRHTGIVVSDLDRAVKFYVSLLGFTVKKESVESGTFLDNALALNGVEVVTVKMSAEDGNLIELICFKSHRRKKRKERDAASIGFTHIAFTVDNLDAEYERLSGYGVRFNAPPQVSSDGYAKLTFCKDPDGNLIELVEVLEK